MVKKRSDLEKLAEERNILAKERTLYAEERTFLAFIRTVIGVVGLLVIIMRLFVQNIFYTKLIVVFIILLGLILLIEILYKFHKRQEKMKNLEERLS